MEDKGIPGEPIIGREKPGALRRNHERLAIWQNAAKLRKLVYDITLRFPRSEMRRISQMQDAARPAKQNIQEGYYRRSSAEYLQGLNVAKGSLGELMGDIQDCYEDQLITDPEFKTLDKLSGQTRYFVRSSYVGP